MDKKELRNTIRVLKKQFSQEELQKKSAFICSQLEKHPKFCQAQTILLYHALSDEVDTRELIRKYGRKKTILLPVVRGETLELKPYINEENLIKENKFGIYEPQGPAYTATSIELALVPGMAFDSTGRRLGRGKGYYDKLFADQLLQVDYKIGVCFDFQLLPEIPTEAHDIVMDEIISDAAK